jgi:hypothetical protein
MAVVSERFAGFFIQTRLLGSIRSGTKSNGATTVSGAASKQHTVLIKNKEGRTGLRIMHTDQRADDGNEVLRVSLYGSVRVDRNFANHRSASLSGNVCRLPKCADNIGIGGFANLEALDLFV